MNKQQILVNSVKNTTYVIIIARNDNMNNVQADLPLSSVD